MQTKYYRHNDPRKGYKLTEQLQIPSQERTKFFPAIQKINQMYHQCADSHSMAFMQQPSENQVLAIVFVGLVGPILLTCLDSNFNEYLAASYFVTFLTIATSIATYMTKIDQCRHKFDQANQKLRQQFHQLQTQFELSWPGYSMALYREWNQCNESCVEYIEVFRKGDAGLNGGDGEIQKMGIGQLQNEE